MRKQALTKILALSMVAALIAPALVFAQESPVIANLRVSEITDISAAIEWSTNQATQGTIEYGLTANYTSKVGFQGESRISHRLTLANLKAETIYHFRAISSTVSTEVYSFDQTFKTTKAIDRDTPVVTDVAIPYQGPSTAVIQWRTNEPADSLVLFGFTTSYGNQRGEGERVMVHDLTITGLQPLTTYHFQVKSKDEGNNVGVSSNFSFRTTSGPAGNSPLDVTSIRPVSINDIGVTDTSADISWRTTNLAEGIVRWGPTDGLGREVRTVRPRNFVHSVRLVDLQPATTYFYQIEARDMFGSTFRTGIYSFATMGGYVAPTRPGQVLGVSSARDLLFYASFDRKLDADYALGEQTAGVIGIPRVTSGAKGRRGEAANLENGSYLQFDGTDNFTLTQGTIAFWFKPAWNPLDNTKYILFDLYPEYQVPGDLAFRIAKYGTVPTPGYELLSNSLYFGLNDEQLVSYHQYFPGTGLRRDQWQFITITWQYGGEHARMYVNGSVAGVLPKTGTRNQNSPLGLEPTGIGDRFNIGSGQIKGTNALIDEFAIFGRQLDSNEIKLLYAEGVKPYLPKPQRPSPIAPTIVPPAPGGGRVLGASTLPYTAASALLQAKGQPDVYAILNGQKHKISGPSSFAAYGYRWSDVRTVKPSVLEKIPYARLVRTPDDPHVFYLYQRPQRQWLKLQIPSPTVFISYPGNFWGNVVTINEIDLDHYPPVRLISANGSTYLLENNRKRLIENDAAFDALQLPRSHVAAVNQTHLDFYPLGEPIR